MSRLNMTQEIIVAAFTMLGALLSLIGSGIIVCLILKRKKFKGSTYHRLLLSLSVSDILSSLGWLMAPVFVPSETSPRYLAIGNTTTCTVVGWLIQYGSAVSFSNAALSVFYLATIKFGVRGSALIWRERVLIGFSHTFGVLSSTAPIPFKLYNELDIGPGCWLSSFPIGCETNPDMECRETSPVLYWGYTIGAFPILSSLVVVIVCNYIVYQTAKRLEVTNRRYSTIITSNITPTSTSPSPSTHSSSVSLDNMSVASSWAAGNNNNISRIPARGARNERQAQRTKDIADQATHYVVIYFNTLFWSLIMRQLDGFDIITPENESSWFALMIIAQFFQSLGGFGNFLVYIRPRYVRFRRREMSPREAFRKALSMKHITVATSGGNSRDGRRSSFAAILPMRLRPSRFETNVSRLSTGPDEENFCGVNDDAAADNGEKNSSGQAKRGEDAEISSIVGHHLLGGDDGVLSDKFASGVVGNNDDCDWKDHLRDGDYVIPVNFGSAVVHEDYCKEEVGKFS